MSGRELFPLTSESDTPAYEFYVSSGSKDLMRHIADIMRSHGFVGLADGGGKMHYVVDGSRNLYEAAAHIRAILTVVSESSAESDLKKTARDKFLIGKAVQEILSENGLKPTLKGYTYLGTILTAMLEKKSTLLVPDKALYARITAHFATGRRQMDRVIHYSLTQAGLTLSNNQAIANFLQQARERLEALDVLERDEL